MLDKLYKDYPRTIVALDYDGTLVNHNEEFSKEVIEALKELQQNNIDIIVWSCRHREHLVESCKRLHVEGVFIEYFNENTPYIKGLFDNESRKIFAHHYFDDQAYGFHKVDWSEFVSYVIEQDKNRGGFIGHEKNRFPCINE